MRMPIAQVIMSVMSLRKSFQGIYGELDELRKELDELKKVNKKPAYTKKHKEL